MSPIRFAAGILAGACGAAAASPFHEFCVTRLVQSGQEVSRTRLYFQAEDPGREAAGLYLIRHYRRSGVATVRVDDALEGACRLAETHHVVLADNPPLPPRRDAEPALPNIGRLANLASGAVTGVAEEASRVMCRVLPC